MPLFSIIHYPPRIRILNYSLQLCFSFFSSWCVEINGYVESKFQNEMHFTISSLLFSRNRTSSYSVVVSTPDFESGIVGSKDTGYPCSEIPSRSKCFSLRFTFVDGLILLHHSDSNPLHPAGGVTHQRCSHTK
jgi:hypothetical protein